MSLVARIAAIGDQPHDSEDARLRHRFLIATAVSMSGGGLVWGALSCWLEMPGPSLIPFGYTALTAVNLWFLAATKRFAVAGTLQIFMSLLLPFLFQWVLGGFVSSGCVMIWAMLSLVAAILSFGDTRTGWLWLGLFLALTIVSGLLEGTLSVPLPLQERSISAAAFTCNVATVSAMVFALTNVFWGLRQRAAQVLVATNAELAESNRRIEASRAALVQSERLAALGHLVAGVAHELNTPLGAIRASVGNLLAVMQEVTSELPHSLAKASSADLDGLQHLLAAAATAPGTATSKEERAQRRSLGAELDEAGLPDSAQMAERLVGLGVTTLGGHRPLLSSPHGPELLQRAHDLAGLRRNSATIALAAERASKVVFALKSYAHPGDASGAPTKASLATNVETVLTLYQSQIKHGVEVTRELDSAVVLAGHHDELNQVWTNLVHNALQAMHQRGQLEVVVTALDGDAIVRVGDDGPGIPDAVLPRIFEPFFTTKAAGEGSGLGLSICRDIVDRHQGRISVESRPGRTVFEVRLPLQGANDATG